MNKDTEAFKLIIDHLTSRNISKKYIAQELGMEYKHFYNIYIGRSVKKARDLMVTLRKKFEKELFDLGIEERAVETQLDRVERKLDTILLTLNKPDQGN